MMGDHLVRFEGGSSTKAFNMCLRKFHPIEIHERINTKISALLLF